MVDVVDNEQVLITTPPDAQPESTNTPDRALATLFLLEFETYPSPTRCDERA